MNKNEFIEAVKVKAGLTKKDCKLALDSILEVIKDALSVGESVTLSNFGKFKVNEIKSKPMYNFSTKRTHLLPERKLPTFKASETLKQSVK